MKKYENPTINMENIEKSFRKNFENYSNENLIRIKMTLNSKFDSNISFSKKPGREYAIEQLNEFIKKEKIFSSKKK